MQPGSFGGGPSAPTHGGMGSAPCNYLSSNGKCDMVKCKFIHNLPAESKIQVRFDKNFQADVTKGKKITCSHYLNNALVVGTEDGNIF